MLSSVHQRYEPLPPITVKSHIRQPYMATSEPVTATVLGQITLMSFSFRQGAPQNVLKKFDLRKWPSASRTLCQSYNGLSARLQKDLFGNREVLALYTALLSEVEASLKEPRHAHASESKTLGDDGDGEDGEHKAKRDVDVSPATVVLAFGCEQGQHRSVAVVERLAQALKRSVAADVNGRRVHVEVMHRDLDSDTSVRAAKPRAKRNHRDRSDKDKYRQGIVE